MSWSIPPTAFGDVVAEDHRQLCTNVAFAIDARLVKASPVGDPSRWKNPKSAPPGYVGGRFRGNWLPSIGSPRTDQVPIRSAAEDLAEAAEVFNAAPVFPVLYLANNLPYAVRLNEGHSGQAPAGFVEGAIDAVVAGAKAL